MGFDPRLPVRERLLNAAHAMIEREGWASVTMAGVAAVARCSRQTVYNEFGTKHGLAESLALRELQNFLDVVRFRMADHTDLVDGIRAACEGVLLMGEQSALVRAIAGTPTPRDMDNDFLKILTTESGQIVDASVEIAQQSIVALYPPTAMTDEELRIVIEATVRLVMSAMTRPSKHPTEAAEDIAWIVGLALEGAAARVSAEGSVQGVGKAVLPGSGRVGTEELPSESGVAPSLSEGPDEPEESGRSGVAGAVEPSPVT